jgi:type II secretion system protein G
MFRLSARRGFTLIELLIVVAIIAILAAIAVPNFLEAQTRSKVSRSKADMRSIATAVESYAVDNNRYPIAAQWVSLTNQFNSRLQGLTTPISYMSSLPVDQFRAKDVAPPVTRGQLPVYEYTDFATGINLVPDPYPGPRLPSYNLFQNQNAADLYYTGRRGVGLKWWMFSVGPDQKSDYQQIASLVSEANALVLGNTRTYDPTNGTVSLGDIARTAAEQRN